MAEITKNHFIKTVDSESIGALTGVIGALLVALGPSLAWYGYLSWCVSNMALIHFSSNGGYRHLTKMQAVYGMTSLYGLFAWY